LFYNIACPEKALADFLYFQCSQIKTKHDIEEQRFNFDSNFDWKKFISIANTFEQEKIKKLCAKIKNIYE